MCYRVVWRERLRTSIHQLTFLTLERGGDANALTEGVEAINLCLQDSPESAGESREDSERVLIVHPLSVFFEAFEEAQVVMIYAAVHYPRTRA